MVVDVLSDACLFFLKGLQIFGLLVRLLCS